MVVAGGVMEALAVKHCPALSAKQVPEHEALQSEAVEQTPYEVVHL